jgi:hypothetical protein
MGLLVSALGCSSSGQFASASGGSGGKADSGGKAGSGAGGGAAGSSTGGAGGNAGGDDGGNAGGGGNVGGTDGGSAVDAGSGGGTSSCSGSCPNGYYCSGCGTGTCKPIIIGTASGAVCGCDGVTYWDAALANHLDKSVRSANPCSSTDTNTKRCVGGTPCPQDSHCNHAHNKLTDCLSLGIDTCWAVPDSCNGPTGKTCKGTCQDACDLIRTEASWYPTSCTPAN